MKRVLIILIAAGMAVLSFDALRAYALNGGVIPTQTIMERAWLAMIWAIVIDLMAVVGVWGIKDDQANWRAWLMLLLALGASFGFQVLNLSSVAARAVPPIGLALAIFVLELGPEKERTKAQKKVPLAERAHDQAKAWSWMLPAQKPGPGPELGHQLAQAQVGPGPEVGHEWPNSGPGPEMAQAQAQVGPGPEVGQQLAQKRPRSGPGPQLSVAQKRKVKTWFEEEKSGRWIATALDLKDQDRRRVLGPYLAELRATQMTQATTNGDKEEVQV